ncbi:hypothetical protein LTR37_010365 [Vermiconidia calcicola]|uniref:Uncharacterized protein n=1 Tax=Vermiconidia calcicola TaxID=1690605 RepID=A0ACC3N575_9PEZI|nr:hypothetical protein LTR37_010365 [Vermiconidia calcicola]
MGDTTPKQSVHESARLPARGGSTKIRRFDGLSRSTSDWDGLRMDTQLWSHDADCLVHFYAHGSSQRGPSLKIPFAAIDDLQCTYLTNHCLRTRASSGSLNGQTKVDSCASSISTNYEQDKAAYGLYIPAPSNPTRDQAFSYHLTTRNFVAYALGKPVVGEKLSIALVELWRRVQEWLPGPTTRIGFVAYLEQQGYLTFAGNSEHALACLRFAEEVRFRDIWMDAFVHCAGMHERLDLSPEFTGISKTTVALITRSSLEMDLHIARVTRAVGGFLDEELGLEHLGLSKPARDHLDHFRSFLHTYYVDKLGWFPPRATARWNKKPWKEMYHEFQRLYDCLVDTESSSDWSSNRAINGGICVIQNVQAFDERHGYAPLAHPLPLLPQAPSRRRHSIGSQKGLRNLKLGKANAIPEPTITASQALASATNRLGIEAVQCRLVQEYQRFERQKLEAKIDIAEARKVRWLLIYGVLQMLTSIMRAPKEVRDAESPSYPVCVLTAGCPPFAECEDVFDKQLVDTTESRADTTLVPHALDALEGRSSRISIHPDCEADSADEFFASNSISRHDSQASLNNMTPAPLRISTQLSRNGSIRSSMHSSVHALHKSVVGSISRRNSIRRNSLGLEPRKVPSPQEIVVEDSDYTVNEEEEIRPRTAVFAEWQCSAPEAIDPLQEFDFDLAATNGEPTLEHNLLEALTGGLEPEYIESSPCESNFSTASVQLVNSSRSSYAQEDDTPDTDLSSWDGESFKRDSVDSNQDTSLEFPKFSQTPYMRKQLCYRPSNPTLGSKSSLLSVNAGTYTPSGMISPPVSRFHYRPSSETVASDASSQYAEESTQAADIEELESRGRQRSRALDRLPYHGGWGKV